MALDVVGEVAPNALGVTAVVAPGLESAVVVFDVANNAVALTDFEGFADLYLATTEFETAVGSEVALREEFFGELVFLAIEFVGVGFDFHAI